MASRNAMIGTGLGLAGLAGLGAAALTLGAPETATPLQPAADTIETQTQVVSTVEDRTKRLKAHRRHDGRTVVRATEDSSGPGPGTRTGTTTTTTQSDDGPNHDVNDDRGGRENELNDDRGGRDNELNDDRGGRDNEVNDGHGGDDDRGETEDRRGPGGGEDDDHSGRGRGGDDRGESLDD